MDQTESPSTSSYTPSATAGAGETSFDVRGLRFRLGAVVVLGAVGAVLLFLIFHGGHKSSAPPAPRVAASAVSQSQLSALAESVKHPVFWLGPKPGMTYELSRQANGSIFVRYLSHGTAVGDPRPALTVATYPFAGAYGALKQIGAQKGARVKTIAHGGLAVVSPGHPDSVHIAYPGVDYQVEVYDPTVGAAFADVNAGRLAAFGSLTAATTTTPAHTTTFARSVSASTLRSLAASLKHPVYWLGPKRGFTYELTQMPNGQLFIRYLPAGVAVGAAKPYLTVGTYPYPAAFAAMHALAKQKGATTVNVSGHGIGVVDESHPDSVHLAYPGSDFEIEVFDPAAGTARQLVGSGEVTAIR